MQPKLSVVVPIFNEEERLGELYERLTKAIRKAVEDSYELLFVNDGSSDHSLSYLRSIAAKDRSVRYISLSRNFGHQIAISAGIDHCLGEAVVIMDGDLQDPPELLPQMYDRHREGFDVVYARRRHREGETMFKRWTARLFYRILRQLTSVEMPLDTGDFRLIDRKIANCLKQMPEQNKFLRGQIAWMGFRQTAIEFDRAERKHGKSAYTFRRMLRLAIDGITGFSNKPLEWVGKLGILVSFLSLIIIIYALYSHFFLSRTIDGWTSVIVSTMFIGGVQLLSIGVIGAYISRINKNIVDRPLYLIAEDNLSIHEEKQEEQSEEKKPSFN